MYIVVIGLGEVGRHLVQVLNLEGHDVVAVDQDPRAIAFAEENYDVATLQGYGAREEILKQAHVGDADLVVGVTNHDEVNLIAALAAKQLGAKRVVARAQGNEWARWTEGVQYGLLGVDVVINPYVLVGQELAKIARSHGASDVIDFAQNRIELVEIEVTTRMVDKPLAQLDLPRDVLVAALVRDHELIIPGGADVLLPHDVVYLIGKPDSILSAEDLFSSRREASRVCIAGGGVVGQVLALELVKQGAQVLLIESDLERARHIAAEIDRVTVVHGDGTDKRVLEEAEVETYDLFCAVSEEDEVNLMAALLARRTGVGRVATTVHRADYISIYRDLGIDIVLSPRAVASDQILRFCRQGQLHSLHELRDGAAEVVELSAMADCRAVGVPLRRLNLPKGALIAGLVRDDEVIIPGGDDIVAAGDDVILIVRRSARPTIERLFRSRRG